LEKALDLFEALQEAGHLSPQQIDEVRSELLESRIRLRQQETDFANARDQCETLSAEQMNRLQQRNVEPLQRHLLRFKEVSDQAYRASRLVEKQLHLPADKLRIFLGRVFITDPLVMGTLFQKKIKDIWWRLAAEDDGALAVRLRRLNEERRRLLDLKSALRDEGKAVAGTETRLRENEFNQDVSELENLLRRYAAGTGDRLGKDNDRRPERVARFRAVARAAQFVLNWARRERMHRIWDTWPTLPPLALKKVDLLKADLEAAIQAVEQLLKPESKLAGRRRLRQLRLLAEIYRTQQALVALAYNGVENLELLMQEAVGAPPVGAATAGTTARQWLAARRSLYKAKNGLYHTWITYLVTRLDLYQELNLTPPEPEDTLPQEDSLPTKPKKLKSKAPIVNPSAAAT
jgi:hypothetical protein